MENKRPYIDEGLGRAIVEHLIELNGVPINMILIVFPAISGGQPGFVTNLSPDEMEETIRTLGHHMTPEFTKSRQVQSDKDRKVN